MSSLLTILLTTVLLFPGEMGPAMLIVQEPHEPSAPLNSTQSLQLHTGWNLVSWYVKLPDPNTPPLTMNDVFLNPNPPPIYSWLNPTEDLFTGDRVGKWDADPEALPIPELYPLPGTSAWTWDDLKAYYIYRDENETLSMPHLWVASNTQNTALLPTTVRPNSAWDQRVEPTRPPNYWWFLSYNSPTDMIIDYDHDGWSTIGVLWVLENDPDNPMLILKSDDGRFYIPGNITGASSLDYLEPGKGYFAGFAHADEIDDCPGWEDELGLQSVPGGGNKSGSSPGSQIASQPTTHFIFKARTHWWYPILIDSMDLGGVIPELGDEIAVFDGDLCVGAAMYPDSFPVDLAAWKDDIATPDIVDGYQEGHEMTFKWFDVSANQEITFTPPPSTQGVDDPVAPTHSGFGYGFYARRGFVSGIEAVTQLPKEFKLGQNFPNPFNAETVIPLELPQRSHVKIELFNVQGRKLGVIFERVENAGTPKIHCQAGQYASGIYFYRVSAQGLERPGKYQAVGKMLLLK
jgi:hypothetical protein